MAHRIAIAALALALSSGAGAQMFKCQDAAGKITYSSQDCAEIGLKSAGEVRDKVNVTPAFKPPAPPPSAPRTAAPQAVSAPEKSDRTDAERRCFTIKTSKGIVTRCNDKPEEDEKK